MISSLYRMPKVLKPSSPSTESASGKNGSSVFSYTKAQPIDVRTIALQLFRDHVIYPIFPTLHDWLNEIKDQFVTGNDLGDQLPRLQQMQVTIALHSPWGASVNISLQATCPRVSTLCPTIEHVSAVSRRRGDSRTPPRHSYPSRPPHLKRS